jgi:hypothetical protein
VGAQAHARNINLTDVNNFYEKAIYKSENNYCTLLHLWKLRGSTAGMAQIHSLLAVSNGIKGDSDSMNETIQEDEKAIFERV